MVHCSQGDVEKNVLKVLQGTMGLHIDNSHIDQCHQINAAKEGSQNVIIKFTSHRHQRLVLQNRRKLKGTGIWINEDLTSARYSLYRKTVEKFGARSVWTLDGKIFVNVKGKKYENLYESDLESVE